MRTLRSRKADSATAIHLPRRLHLIDIENEVMGRVTPASCREFAAAYAGLGIVGAHDQVIVGVSPNSLLATFVLPFEWRRVMGPDGPQSADEALLGAVSPTGLHSRFSELVIASSDHVFLELALRARQVGLLVTLVTNQSRTPHWRLYIAAHRHLTVAVSSADMGAVA